jgi:hypothetical protein
MLGLWTGRLCELSQIEEDAELDGGLQLLPLYRVAPHGSRRQYRLRRVDVGHDEDRPRYDDPCAGRLHRQRRFSAPGSTLCCALRAAYGQRCYITHSDRLACHVAAPFLSHCLLTQRRRTGGARDLRPPSSWQLHREP